MRNLALGISGALIGHFFLFSLPLIGLPNQGNSIPAVDTGGVTIRFFPKPYSSSKVMPPAPRQVHRKSEQQNGPVQKAATKKPAPLVPPKKPVTLEAAGGSDRSALQQEATTAMAASHETPDGEEKPIGPGTDSGQDALSLAVHRTNPQYPALARKRGWQGTVLLVLFIEADGSVTKLEVHRTSGHRMLDKAALEAVRQWRFQPLHKNGMAGRRLLPISFRLQD